METPGDGSGSPGLEIGNSRRSSFFACGKSPSDLWQGWDRLSAENLARASADMAVALREVEEVEEREEKRN